MEVTPVLKVGFHNNNQSDHYNPSDHWNFSMTGEMVFLELSGIVGKLRYLKWCKQAFLFSLLTVSGLLGFLLLPFFNLYALPESLA